MVTHQKIAEWRGKDLVDNEGDKIGRLEDVDVDVETDEAIFGTVKEGLIGGRHLTFEPLVGITIGPDSLQAPVTGEQVKGAPDIALDGDELPNKTSRTSTTTTSSTTSPRDRERRPGSLADDRPRLRDPRNRWRSLQPRNHPANLRPTNTEENRVPLPSA